MNILIIGSGGREHAFAHMIDQSRHCNRLFVAPGNAGTAAIATNLPIAVNDFDAIRDVVIEHKITMVVVGPEDPLVNGIADYFSKDEVLRQVHLIGPSAEGAQLEGSKEYAKEFMARHGIPTAAYQSFTADRLDEGKAFLETMKAPYVLKADGLAAGKGVLILDDLQEAKNELEQMLDRGIVKKFSTLAELAAGRLGAGAHVYGPGMTAWEPIGSRPEFSSAVPASAPPPPPQVGGGAHEIDYEV